MNRRRFLSMSAGAAGTLWAAPAQSGFRFDVADAFIREKMEADHILGVSAAILDRHGIVWEKAYGWADIEMKEPMSLDSLQNIGSISKTFTTTAAMQLRDQGFFELDDDINEYLPFRLRNPHHPEVPITFRHLMTHVSSLRDGSAYSEMYACGDPTISLGKWIREYFGDGGYYDDPAENFEEWAPGEHWRYCNTSYGVLAYLVERVSGVPFPEYCRRRIFSRLDLPQTRWFISRIDEERHVVPYAWMNNGEPRSPNWGGRRLGVLQDGARAPNSGRDVPCTAPIVCTTIQTTRTGERTHGGGDRPGAHKRASPRSQSGPVQRGCANRGDPRHRLAHRARS